jgi:hypothetical protein
MAEVIREVFIAFQGLPYYVAHRMINFKRSLLDSLFPFLILGALISSSLVGCSRWPSSALRESTSPADFPVSTSGPQALDDGTFTNVYQNTLKTACIQCHVPGGAPTNDGVKLDFTDQNTAYQTLMGSNVSGQISVGSCGGIKIVNPGNPASSYLAGVLFSEYNTDNFAGVSTCKPYTAHLTDQNLSADEKTAIISWIQSGAPNN